MVRVWVMRMVVVALALALATTLGARSTLAHDEKGQQPNAQTTCAAAAAAASTADESTELRGVDVARTSREARDALMACLAPFDAATNPVARRPLHLVWVGGPELGALYRRNLRIFILTHAAASSPVFVWSNELSSSFIASVAAEADAIRAKTGLKNHKTWATPSRHVHLVRYDLVKLMQGYPGSDVAQIIASVMQADPGARQLFIVHTSDLLRYFLVWRFGGFYSDLDILTLRPLLSLPPGWVSVDTKETSVTTCTSPSVPSRSLMLTCLCNGLLSFTRGDVLMRTVLESAHTFFPHPRFEFHYGVLGAILVMYVLRGLGHPYYELRPVTGDYAMCNKYQYSYNSTTLPDSLVDELVRRCSVAHIYGQGKSDMVLPGGEASLLGRMYARIERQLASGDGVITSYADGVS